MMPDKETYPNPGLVARFLATLRTRMGVWFIVFRRWPLYLRITGLMGVIAVVSLGVWWVMSLAHTSVNKQVMKAPTFSIPTSPTQKNLIKPPTTSSPKPSVASPSSSGTTSNTKSTSVAQTGTQSTSSGSGSGGGTTSGTGSGTGGTSGGGTTPTSSYVLPGTQGYLGDINALTLYSAANGKTPSTDCSWNQTYKYLNCNGTDLTLSNAYIQGGIYWSGCGSLNINNSVIEWAPSQTWHNIYAQCATGLAGATLTVTHSTLRATATGQTYNVSGQDIAPLWTGSDRPMLVSNCLIEEFPQGLDPTDGSVIQNNEIYTADNGTAHVDGLFSQGGANVTEEGNYIKVPGNDPQVTASIFWKDPTGPGGEMGNKVLNNYLYGGSYSLFNVNSLNLEVTGNTFAGGYVNGYACLYNNGVCSSTSSTASWGTWSGNVDANGATVSEP